MTSTNRRYYIEITGTINGKPETERVSIIGKDEEAYQAVQQALANNAKKRYTGLQDAKAKLLSSELLGWAVITEGGLTCWVNLTEEKAREIAANPTPAGTPQVAVPERVAEVAAEAWKDLQAHYDRKLAEARVKTTANILAGYGVSV